MPTEITSWVGQVLSGGRYQVTAKLGEGGMAFVFRAADRHLGCDVVVKVPRPALLQEPEFAGRFAYEVRSLVQLQHPHIVKLIDVGTHDGIPFAVMQYLPGGSLRDRLQPGPDGVGRPRPPGELRGWLGDVAGTLDFMHKEGYLHRDVKPDNILFDQHGHVFLSDFGIAKALAGVEANPAHRTVLTNAGMMLGTAPYMAPEVILGEPCDGGADQYALAVTVYQMLSGVVPYDGATPAAIVMQQAARTAPPLHERLPGLTRALSAAVHKALHRDPRQRFADCQAFARAVLEALQGAPAPAWTPGDTGSLRSVPTPPQSSPVVACPRCGQTLKVPATAHGSQNKARCPRCRASFRLPAASRRSGGTEPLVVQPVFPPAGGARAGKRPLAPTVVEPRSLSGRGVAILVAGGVGLVACLVLAIIMLVIRGDHDAPDIQPQATLKVNTGNGQQKANDGRGKAVSEAGGGSKKVLDDGKGRGYKKPLDDKKGSEDGKKGSKVEPPKGPTEAPPGPPSKRVVEVGTYEPPMQPATAVLRQYKPGGKSEWERLVKGLKPPRVLTGRPLVSLPAYRSAVKTDSGVRLTLVGTVPEFVLGLPLFESRVVLHQHDAFDLDLTLQRGRIVRTNLRADRPARFRVRFENTTDPDAQQMWDLTLEEKDTEILVDRLSFYDGEPFYDNPKHPNRKGPVSNLGLIVLRGSVALRAGNVTHRLQPPPGPALMIWDSRKGPSGPHPLKELPPWAKANPPTPKGLESVRADMERAAVQFGSDLSGWPVELGLEKALKSTDKSLRKLAIRSFGALDRLPQLVDALGDVNRPDVRFDAIETLRYWIAASRDTAYTLLAQLKSSDYTPIESEKIVSLLHNYSKDDQGRLETYNTLIDQLVSPKVAIRELSAWHLYRLVPDAQKGIPWGATAPQADLQRIRGQWREMIRHGKLPPAQKAPAGD